MSFVCKYIALRVSDLRAAEEFYGRALAMDVLFRETERDGSWWTLPPATDWQDALAAGVEVRMVALRRHDFVLALFLGAPAPKAVYEISLGLAADEIDRWREHPPNGVTIVEQRDAFVRFDDPFGYRWVLQEAHLAFSSSGAIAGRWLEL